jgi:hypothetical protein
MRRFFHDYEGVRGPGRLSKIIIHAAKAKSKASLDEIDVEQDWIRGLQEQVEFLNSNMKHHCILFRVQKRQFVTGDTP